MNCTDANVRKMTYVHSTLDNRPSIPLIIVDLPLGIQPLHFGPLVLRCVVEFVSLVMDMTTHKNVLKERYDSLVEIALEIKNRK